MKRELNHFLKKQNRLTKMIFGIAFLILLILYSLVGIVYKNYNINRQMQQIKTNIESLKTDNIEEESKILYYGTDTYQEKILREKLGYQKEGEKVYALPRTDPEREKLIREQKLYQEEEDRKPNIIKWWEFFFKRNMNQQNTTTE